MYKRVVKVFLLLFFSVSCFAKEVDNSAVLNEVEEYLNNIKYLTANFLQDDVKNSQLSEGVLYISRPGKLRIDYQNPFEASLYTYNRVTTYYDKELDEITNVRTSTTPLQFLLKKEIKLNNKSFTVTDVSANKSTISISFVQKNKEDEGTLTLKFKKNPMTLLTIELSNGIDQEVEITLFNISTEPIKNSLFIFNNPRLKKNI